MAYNGRQRLGQQLNVDWEKVAAGRGALLMATVCVRIYVYT